MALKNVRNHDGVRVLWVDALCINQNDVGERSKQVVLMKEIYGRAVRVLICLDIEDLEDSLGESSHSDACSAVREIADLSEPHPSDPTPWKRPGYVEPPFPPHSGRHISLLVCLFSCKWFLRIWVVQEVVLAKETIVIIGKEKLEWAPLGRTAIRVTNHRSPYQTLLPRQIVQACLQTTAIDVLKTIPYGKF